MMHRGAESVDGLVLARLVEDLSTRGYSVAADFLDASTIASLRANALELDRAGRIEPAAGGRGTDRRLHAGVRGDRIHWLDDTGDDPAEACTRGAFEALRLAVNRELALGLFDLEAHYAAYPAGAGYARHRDCFTDDEHRVLSIVLYLNRAWRPSDGGRLRIHLPDATVKDVLPVGGTLVAFLSAQFEHEVLPAARERVSIAGWFRTRA